MFWLLLGWRAFTYIVFHSSPCASDHSVKEELLASFDSLCHCPLNHNCDTCIFLINQTRTGQMSSANQYTGLDSNSSTSCSCQLCSSASRIQQVRVWWRLQRGCSAHYFSSGSSYYCHKSGGLDLEWNDMTWLHPCRLSIT